MMRLTAVVALFTDLPEAELVAWTERGWVRPVEAPSGLEFDEIDIARVRLIHDLRSAMQIEDETIPVVLSLLDQVHDLRAELRAVLRAVEAQPEAVRRAILTAMA
jgi:chaperone modulatory protein CbpM